ncbi:hypothetical protein N7510_004665 [Penicillium lagena]|uniref:uncharacterized protein n=1 Tax=Penicillium lagena TaxID=94218 RepID=UPI002541AD30|nr:uncharacterized protein N7510_004665 [Penicillium lagena]KAJ5620681.1 hypothetical protein N7510_004665 [Penicillium lagena]
MQFSTFATLALQVASLASAAAAESMDKRQNACLGICNVLKIYYDDYGSAACSQSTFQDDRSYCVTCVEDNGGDLSAWPELAYCQFGVLP